MVTTPRSTTDAPTARQLASIEAFDVLDDRDIILSVVIAYVERYLPLAELGVTWGVTFCPTGSNPAFAVINAGSGVCPLAIGTNNDEGRTLGGFVAMRDTADAYGLAERFRRGGHTVHQHTGHSPVPWAGFGFSAWDPFVEFVNAADQLIGPFVDAATRRRLLNRGWHNPAAGDLLLDAMGRRDEWLEGARPHRSVRPQPTRSSRPPRRIASPAPQTPLCPGCGLLRSAAQFVAASPLCVDCR